MLLAACGGTMPETTESVATEQPTEVTATETVTRTVKLSGTITGLSEGRKLRLQHESETLTLTENGPFEFTTPVTEGATYSVSIAGQPLWQFCKTQAASGEATADGSAISVNCVDAVAQVSTLAGYASEVNYGTGIDVDNNNTVYTSDGTVAKIYKKLQTGELTTHAGAGGPGYVDGPGDQAMFKVPFGLAVDENGVVYVADRDNHAIRKVLPSGEVSTLAGSGASGNLDGQGTAASFEHPFGLAFEKSGAMVVTQRLNGLIRRISPEGIVSTIAQNVGPSFGIAAAHDGFIYVTGGLSRHQIERISPDGEITIFAGSGASGYADGMGTEARFNSPLGIAIDADGLIYVSESYGNRIRRITPSGKVTTLAGSGSWGAGDGDGTNASFYGPVDLAVNRDGVVFVLDRDNNRVRKITPVEPQP